MPFAPHRMPCPGDTPCPGDNGHQAPWLPHAGLDSAELVSQMRAAHVSDQHTRAGVDVVRGVTGDMQELGIYEAFKARPQRPQRPQHFCAEPGQAKCAVPRGAIQRRPLCSAPQVITRIVILARAFRISAVVRSAKSAAAEAAFTRHPRCAGAASADQRASVVPTFAITRAGQAGGAAVRDRGGGDDPSGRRHY